jgi:hypothetical protein
MVEGPFNSQKYLPHKTPKELKNKTSNDEGNEKAMLRNEDVLIQGQRCTLPIMFSKNNKV